MAVVDQGANFPKIPKQAGEISCDIDAPPKCSVDTPLLACLLTKMGNVRGGRFL